MVYTCLYGSCDVEGQQIIRQWGVSVEDEQYCRQGELLLPEEIDFIAKSDNPFEQ